MREFEDSEARDKLGELLDLVEAGEEVVITRHGEPVAKLVPSRASVDPDRARRAIAAIHEMRKGTRLDGLKLKDLIDEGRR